MRQLGFLKEYVQTGREAVLGQGILSHQDRLLSASGGELRHWVGFAAENVQPSNGDRLGLLLAVNSFPNRGLTKQSLKGDWFDSE